MVTELLEQVVIKWFDEADVDYIVRGDDTVEITYPSSIGIITIHIYDHEYPVPALSIIVNDFVRFPPNEKAQAESMCNVLNRRVPGKFIVDEDMALSYSIFFPLVRGTGPMMTSGTFCLLPWLHLKRIIQ